MVHWVIDGSVTSINVSQSPCSCGTTINQMGRKGVNREMQTLLKTDEDYVVAIDTDSLYIRMGSLDHFDPRIL